MEGWGRSLHEQHLGNVKEGVKHVTQTCIPVIIVAIIYVAVIMVVVIKSSGTMRDIKNQNIMFVLISGILLYAARYMLDPSALYAEHGLLS